MTQVLPLHQAVKNSSIEQVRILLQDPSIDNNQEDENGVTALIEACISGNETMVKILLEEGNCPAQPSSPAFRHSPLRGATVCGHFHLIPLLLEYGADPNALSEGNRTPLMGGCFLRQNTSIASTGNEKQDQYDYDDESRRSELCVRALLLDERTDPTIVNSFGETALDLAKRRNYVESISLLEEAIAKWQAK